MIEKLVKRELPRCLLLVAAAALVSCGSRDAPAQATDSRAVQVIPAPREVLSASGVIVVPTTAAVASSSEDFAARYFVDLVNRTRGTAFKLEKGASAPIRFDLNTRSGESPESYSLRITPQEILVSASNAQGLFYGAVTLWQMISALPDGDIRLPAMMIQDSPRFRWRGLMLDSARHFQSPEFIKHFIDAMAIHKLNVLHWHLTDDQAWRLEIKKYPKLTSVGAWRVPAGAAHEANIDPSTQQPRLYGGFYTQDQVRDVVAYAAQRHITIVPEIEMPGHASAPIAAYPTLAVQGHAVRKVPADWGVYPSVFNVEESTFGFLEDVLAEVIELFPSEYIHVGGDEAVKDQWKASPNVQQRMRELGIKDEHALQSYFIQRMERFLNSQGRRLIGWDEILEGGLAPNATVMSWRGIDGAVAAAKAGHDTVLSPHPTLYLDNRPFEARVPGRERIISVKDVYAFDPAPAELTDDQRRHVLGVQANIWTEHIRTEARVEYMAFPRAAALAEVAWSAPERMDYADFERRLPEQIERYRSLNIRFAEANPTSAASERLFSHDLTLCSKNIALSLEDDAPVEGERAVFLVDIMNPCWILSDVDLAQPTQLAVSVGQVPFNFQIGADIEKIQLRAPQRAPGELHVRLGCEGERIAVLPLSAATGSFAVTDLPTAKLGPRPGRHSLCFQFAQATLDPLWVLHSVTLLPGDAVRTSE